MARVAGAASKLWRPYAPLDDGRSPITIVRGQASSVWDDIGRRYLDVTAGQWFCAVGWGRDEIVRAMTAQLGRLHAYTTFSTFTNDPAEELAARLAESSPVQDGRVFLTSGGSDAVDTAVKLARQYWYRQGRASKRVVISRHGSYHGLHGIGTALSGIPANREGYTFTGSDTVVVAAQSADELLDTIDHLGADAVAAFIAEPVIGVGGVYPASASYWARVQQICRENEVLFIVDEVITAFGRLGHAFASHRLGLEPDLLIFAKAVTSGYAGLGGVIASARVQEPFREQGWRHGYTFSGHATASAAALANLDTLASEAMYERADAAQHLWTTTLAAIGATPLVSAVRHDGLLAAVEISGEAIAEAPDLVDRIVAGARAGGVLTRALTAAPALQLSPPLCITDSEITFAGEVLISALHKVACAA